VKPQSAAVLRLLRDGITALDALQEAGTLRLAARIVAVLVLVCGAVYLAGSVALR
jgi:hypothetical protein